MFGVEPETAAGMHKSLKVRNFIKSKSVLLNMTPLKHVDKEGVFNQKFWRFLKRKDMPFSALNPKVLHRDLHLHLRVKMLIGTLKNLLKAFCWSPRMN